MARSFELLTVFQGRQPGYFLEFPVEMRQVRKAAFKGNLRNAEFVFHEQFAGVADADFVQKLEKGFRVLLLKYLQNE